MEQNTKVFIVEINHQRETSSVWTAATTVKEVIAIINENTALSAVQPVDFLDLNNGFDEDDFLDDNGEFDHDKAIEWENALPIEAHFQAAIDCASDDGCIIRVYWSREEAEEAGTPPYMLDLIYKLKMDKIFGEI